MRYITESSVGALSDWSDQDHAQSVHLWFRGIEATSDFSIDAPTDPRSAALLSDPMFADTPFWYETSRGNTWLGEQLFLAADILPWQQVHHAVYLRAGRRYLIAYRIHPGRRGRHAECRFHDLDAYLRLSDTLTGPWRDALAWLWGALAEHHRIETPSGRSLFYSGYSAPEIVSAWMQWHCDATEGDRLFSCLDHTDSLDALAQSVAGAEWHLSARLSARLSEQASLFAAIDRGFTDFVAQHRTSGYASWDELIFNAGLFKKSAPVLMKSVSESASLEERMADMALAAMGSSDREMWRALAQCGAHAALLQNLWNSRGRDSALLVMLYCYCESMQGDRGS